MTHLAFICLFYLYKMLGLYDIVMQHYFCVLLFKMSKTNHNFSITVRILRAQMNKECCVENFFSEILAMF